MENVLCNLCGSEQSEQLCQNLPDYYLNTPDVHATFVRCTNCGLIYQNPRPTFEEISKYYEGDYPPFVPQSGKPKSGWLITKSVQYGQNKRRRDVIRKKSGGKLLDVGCASGAFLENFKAFSGFELYGVEINSQAADAARKLGLDIRTGTLKEASFSADFFDVITMWDVLEHLHDPVASLNEIWRILKPGGVIVMRVPNGECLDAFLFRCTWAGWDPPRHLFVFTSKTLRKILAKTGFLELDARYNSDAYPSFLLSLRFKLGASASPAAWKNRLFKILHHPIAQLISAPFFFLIGMSKRGQTMVVSAQKPFN